MDEALWQDLSCACICSILMSWVQRPEDPLQCLPHSSLKLLSCMRRAAALHPKLVKKHIALWWASLWNAVQQHRRLQIPLALLWVWSLLIYEVRKKESSSENSSDVREPWIRKLVCLFPFCKHTASLCSVDRNRCVVDLQLRFHCGLSGRVLKR